MQRSAPVPGLTGLTLLVFDLDGTLIDSREDLAASVNAMLAVLRRAALPLPVVESYVGNGAALLVQRALGLAPSPAQAGVAAEPRHLDTTGEEAFQRGLRLFLDHYQGHLLDRTRLYPGMADALAVLSAHFRLAVLSNKPEAMSREILRGLGVEGRFAFIYGGDSFAAKKPDPGGLLALIERVGTVPGATLMIGDSAVDIRTGRAAGARTCGVTYGFAAAGFASEPPDLRVDSPAELAATLLPAPTVGE